MNWDKKYTKFNDYLFNGVRLTDINSRGRLLYRDREITMIDPKTKTEFPLSENQLRDALEDMEQYLHQLPETKSIEQLFNRVRAGLPDQPKISSCPLDANNISALLDWIYDRKIVDCRPEHFIPVMEAE